jgi:hypothetical protein
MQSADVSVIPTMTRFLIVRDASIKLTARRRNWSIEMSTKKGKAKPMELLLWLVERARLSYARYPKWKKIEGKME